MADTVSRADVLAVVERWAEATWEEGAAQCGAGQVATGAMINSCANVLEQILADLRALPSATPEVESIIRDVAELPDRTSPEDWPEAMLVTADELRTILRDALATKAAKP